MIFYGNCLKLWTFLGSTRMAMSWSCVRINTCNLRFLLKFDKGRLRRPTCAPWQLKKCFWGACGAQNLPIFGRLRRPKSAFLFAQTAFQKVDKSTEKKNYRLVLSNSAKCTSGLQIHCRTTKRLNCWDSWNFNEIRWQYNEPVHFVHVHVE